MYDVVISGAGPSGSQCAEVLAKNGYIFIIFHKKNYNIFKKKSWQKDVIFVYFYL